MTDVYEPSVTTTNTTKLRTRISYDLTGSRIIKVETGYGTAEKRIALYEWYNNGAALWSVTDAENNLSTVYEYDALGKVEVHVDKERRGKTAKPLWRWMKRRAGVEPSIGHLKQEHRMDRNRLKGISGDLVNAIMSAAGMNFRKLIRQLADFFVFITGWHILGFSGRNPLSPPSLIFCLQT